MSRRFTLNKTTLSSLSTVVTILAVIVCKVGYAKPESARTSLQDEGYTDISFDGRTMWGCDSSFYRTQFLAKNSRGITVRGVVCEDFFSGAKVIKRK